MDVIKDQAGLLRWTFPAPDIKQIAHNEAPKQDGLGCASIATQQKQLFGIQFTSQKGLKQVSPSIPIQINNPNNNTVKTEPAGYINLIHTQYI